MNFPPQRRDFSTTVRRCGICLGYLGRARPADHADQNGDGRHLPNVSLSPSVVAQAFATLGLLYPGRVFLGLGSGEALNETAATGAWAKKPERSERLVEAIVVIRQLWTGQHVKHQGKYYHVNARLYDVPAIPVPIFIAGNGPQALRRAGHYGDGLITDPKSWQKHKAEFEAGAKAAGKDPAQLPILVEHFVVVGDKKDTEAAAQLWRFLLKAWKPYFNIPGPRTIQERAPVEVPLEEVYKEWPVSTDPEVHVQALLALFKAGATEAHIHSSQQDQMRVINFYRRDAFSTGETPYHACAGSWNRGKPRTAGQGKRVWVHGERRSPIRRHTVRLPVLKPDM